MMREFLKYQVLPLARAALLYVVPAFGLSSCIVEYPVGQDSAYSEEHATMMIYLGMNSRSSSSDRFEAGVGYENYIDIPHDNFRIYFFDSDNKYIDSFHTVFRPSVSPDKPEADGGLMFSGYIRPTLGSKFKIVVIANWKDYPVAGEMSVSYDDSSFALIKGKTTIKDLTTHEESKYAALKTPEEDAPWLGMDRLIPFYGVRSYDLSVTHKDLVDEDGNVLPGRMIDLKDDPIPLIRAMARVEVILDHPVASFESVQMTKVHDKGFCAPYKDKESDNWNFDYSDYCSGSYSEPEDWDKNYVRGVHLYPESVISSLNLTKISDRKENTDGSVIPEKWVAYVPEYRNIDVDDFTTLRVRLKKPATADDAESPSSVSGDDSYCKDIYFSENGNKDGIRYNIERNNVYRFVVDGLNADMKVRLDVQPYAKQELIFSFGLMRDNRGDLMVLPDAEGIYPEYFTDFINDDNPNHKYPVEEDENGKPTTGNNIVLEEGDYYAIVVGEYQEMSDAVVWVKDNDGCHVLSNFGSDTDDQKCRARLVESFFGNNQSEKFYKDVFGYRRVYHFDNHNSIVRDPRDERLLFCVFDDFENNDQSRKYYEVESWDDNSTTGWIINKDADGNEVGFQKINEDGTLGESIPINVDESTD